jgi:hypothetical protein
MPTRHASLADTFVVSSEPSPQAPPEKSWRESPRTERVAALVFFSAIWILSLAMGPSSGAQDLRNIAGGLALAVASPMAFSDSPVVWRICKWPAMGLIAAVFVLQVAAI